MNIAKIAIPHPFVSETLDYVLPGDLSENAEIGKRVIVPFGKQKVTGYIVNILSSATESNKSLKIVEEVIDESPLLTSEIIEVCQWTADYYFNSLGEVLKSSLPPGINVEFSEKIRITETGLSLINSFSINELHTEKETRIATLLDSMKTSKGKQVSELKNNFPANLISQAISENLIESFSDFNQKSLSLKRKAIQINSDVEESIVEEKLKHARKQREAWAIINHFKSPVLFTELYNEHGLSRSIVKGLINKNLAIETEVEIRRNPFDDIKDKHSPPHPLTETQRTIYEPIRDAIGDPEYHTFLIHGVTGSGKTEIYLHLIADVIENDGTALILIPEISLTPQFARRFYQIFGEQLAILHSGLSSGERMDEWFRIKRGEAKVVLGTRLSVFSPLQNLKLIIVDEEHDQSYKQDDKVIFNARDLAVFRAANTNAICVLGSATPSAESMVNAHRKKYSLLRLDKRVFDRPLPRIQLVDLRSSEKSNEEQLLPDLVENHLQEKLEAKEQAIIMMGRKGHSSFVLCRACGHSFECKNCSISMTWHEKIEKLKCHYCGKISNLPGFCPACGSPSIELLGMGTAKIEEYLKKRFPEANIDRMDRDVVNRPADYARILKALESGKTDILVGTQMLAKGHDYANVTTIVTLGIDGILRLPDFRHSERVFQLLTQVAGRAGRGKKPGTVFFCTYRPDHFAISTAAEADYSGFYNTEFEFRSSLQYPPYGYMTLLTVEKYKKPEALLLATEVMEMLHSELGTSAIILGPSLAPYARLKNRWRYQLVIKALDRVKTKDVLHRLKKSLKNPLDIKIIVDPVSVM